MKKIKYFFNIIFLILFFIPSTSAIIPPDNVLDNQSYVQENNTNTSFDPENREIFEPEETTVLTPTSSPIISNIFSSSSSDGGSSGGGGGGGSGITSTEDFSNILQFEQREGTLLAGQQVSFKFNLSIYEILLIGKENEYDVSVRVELLKDKPQIAIVKPEGEVIQYFNVATSTKRLKEAVIRFKSNQSVNLFGWSGSSWEDLIGYTENVCMDCYVYSITNFSSFAIAKRETYIEQTPEPAATSIPIEPTIPIQSPIPKQASGFNVSVVIITFIFALFVSGLWQLRKKS